MGADADAVRAIFVKALGGGSGPERRAAALAADARDPAELQARFAPLDALIDRLLARLDELVAEEAARQAAPADETVLDLGEADVVEVTDDAGQSAAAAAVLVEETPETELAPPVPKKRTGKQKKAKKAIDHAAIATTLLYEDVIWLLGMNDGEGALISLERLLVTHELEGEIGEFVELNKAKLLNLYEGYIGPFEKVPKLKELEPGFGVHPAYNANPKIQKIMAKIDGKRSIAKLIKASKMHPLEVACVINQLRRAGLIEV